MISTAAEPGSAEVLVTVPFPDALVDDARDRVRPWTLTSWDPAVRGPVPADVWADTQVLYTHDTLPGAGEAPRLRLVQLDTAGSDHVRGTWLWNADVAITTLAGLAPPATAGYVFATMLAHAHRVPRLLAYQADRRWPDLPTRRRDLTPRLLDGAQLGVLGYGRIGREIGRIGKAFGMEVHGLRRTAPPDDGARRDSDPHHWWAVADLSEMVAACDFVVIALPHTHETHHLVDRGVVAALRRDAFVVNVGRGGVVDEAALLDRLEAEELAGAAFDVFAAEPLPPDSRWWTAPGALVTPHVAGFTPRYEHEAVDLLCANVERLRDGRALRNRLDPERGY